MDNTTSIFNQLNAINVNGKTEKKGNLTYLSWAWAWGEVKKLFPSATYTIYERETEYGPVNYFTDGRTCWVKTGVTIDGLEHIEELPVMDFKNNSIVLEKITSFDVNKAIQRSLTKACARHGLGLYIYAGEDLPEDEAEAKKSSKTKEVDANQILVDYATIKATMDSYGIDFREKLNDNILKATKLPTQDITQLDPQQIATLVKYYNALVKKFKQQKGV